MNVQVIINLKKIPTLNCINYSQKKKKEEKSAFSYSDLYSNTIVCV